MNTRYKIFLCATNLFLERGYTNTYVTTITNSLKISTGNLTFHFPTKEHILAELIMELNAFQHQLVEQNDSTEESLIRAYLLELAMFASICEENANIRDLSIAAYTHQLSLSNIRENDTQRAMLTFKEFCPNWTETDFIQAENVVSGIEYAMFRRENTGSLSLEQIITSSIDSIMKIYEIPETVRRSIIAEVISEDYRGMGSLVFDRFKKYIKIFFQSNKKEQT